MHYLHLLWGGLPVIPATIGLLAVFMLLAIRGIGESASVAVGIYVFHLSSMALALVPATEVREIYQNDLLSRMGNVAGGTWLTWLISADAVLVLSGATLTSYIGVTGLIRRMTLDRCLPRFFLKENRRRTSHRIIISFFLLSVSVLFITKGDLTSLAAVYTLSFLAVMALFAIGNLMLKFKRAKLPRPIRASYLTVLVALGAVSVAFLGNARLNGRYLVVFFEYLIPALLIVTIMLTRAQILKLTVFMVDELRIKIGRERIEAKEHHDSAAVAKLGRFSLRIWKIEKKLQDVRDKIRAQQIVFFTRGDHLENLNRVKLYIQTNGHSDRARFIHVTADKASVPPKLEGHLQFLDEAYPDIDIKFEVIEGEYSAELIYSLSEKWNIPTDMMFIGSLEEAKGFELADLGGVRLIV